MTMAPRLAPFWVDLDPGAAGSVHVDADPTNNVYYVTFLGVPQYYYTTSTITAQVALYGNGNVEFRYQNCSAANWPMIVGFSPGNGAHDPGARDLSTATPFTTGPELAPDLWISARPIIGNVLSLTTNDIPNGTPLGAAILSLTQYNPGIDLTSTGMPGCRQLVGLDAVNLFVPVGTAGAAPLPLPNRPSLVGVQFFAQTAAFSGGNVNARGVLLSNGLDLVVGNQ
jgi:hypothetical protein